MAACERDRQKKKTNARVGDECVPSREGTYKTKEEACTRSLEDHTTSMRTDKSRRMTDNRGRVEPMKR